MQLPYTPPTDGPVSAAALAADPAAARAADLRARGKALVARRRQKQLEEKEGQLAAMLQVQAQVSADIVCIVSNPNCAVVLTSRR